VTDVGSEVARLQELIVKRDDAEAVMFGHLKRLGYV
jgi:type I restriction enzyme M protein